jgi:hypothetical protein
MHTTGSVRIGIQNAAEYLKGEMKNSINNLEFLVVLM